MSFYQQADKLRLRTGVRQRALSRLWAAFALLTFFAFADQAYLTQTHEVTAQFEAAMQGATQHQDIRQNGGKHAPGPNHGTSCPLCQTIAASGAYLAPAETNLFVPVPRESRTELPLLTRATVASNPGHIWRGRAPPLL